jgi:hypothetical protein
VIAWFRYRIASRVAWRRELRMGRWRGVFAPRLATKVFRFQRHQSSLSVGRPSIGIHRPPRVPELSVNHLLPSRARRREHRSWQLGGDRRIALPIALAPTPHHTSQLATKERQVERIRGREW